MTIIQLAACTVCCLGPPLAVYKGTNISSQNGSRLVIFLSATFYLLALFVKSLIIATLMPSSLASYSICQIIGDIIGIALDILGIYVMLQHKQSLVLDVETRLVSIALGYSLGYVFCSNAHHFTRAASLSNFHMADFYSAASSNIYLIIYMGLTTAIYILSRKNIQGVHSQPTIITTILLLSCPLFTKHLVRSAVLSTSVAVLTSGIGKMHIFALIIDAAVALGFSAIIQHLFCSMQKSSSVKNE